MATVKKTQHKSFVRNPPKNRLNLGKKTTNKPAQRRKRNPPAVIRSKRRRTATSNPSGGTLFAAAGGALAVGLFDLTVNTYLPQISGLFRTGAKFAVGFGIGKWGSKLPLIGAYANTISNAFYLLGFVDLVQTYVIPQIANVIAPRQQVARAVPAELEDGGMGQVWEMPNGEQFQIQEVNDFDNGGVSESDGEPFDLDFNPEFAPLQAF